jgi:acetylxylan esterase
MFPLKLKDAAILLLAPTLLASPVELQKRQCPDIHVFGARETTAPAGYGSSATVVDLILNAHSGATSEAINYPACGGQSSCGGVSYANSVVDGINAVTTAVNNFNSECPDAQLVLVGYLQGGQIFDDALCGGGDPNEGYYDTSTTFTAAALNQIEAAIFMGDPRFEASASYDVGTCEAGGVSGHS